jgi:hypothetical protein
MINQSDGPRCATSKKSKSEHEAHEGKGTSSIVFFFTSWPSCSLLLLSFRQPDHSGTGHSFLAGAHLTNDAGQHSAVGA